LNFKNLNARDLQLIELADDLIKKRKSRRSGVAAALRTANGRIFRGINIDIEASAPCSMCAEYGAIAKMVSEGEDKIATIVAVSLNHGVIPPCGRCRQFMSEFGEPYVIIETNGKIKKTKLTHLNPVPAV
jgi:cytidine deaminase